MISEAEMITTAIYEACVMIYAINDLRSVTFMHGVFRICSTLEVVHSKIDLGQSGRTYSLSR